MDSEDLIMSGMDHIASLKRSESRPPAWNLWLGQPAPRYTSFPPATAFHEGVTAHDYAVAIAALTGQEPASLYIHIPFCRELCLYCGCHTSVTHRNERITHYLAALHREMKRLAGLLPVPQQISQIHLGGGTPNILTDRAFKELFAALNSSFDLRTCREIAIELDPRHVSAAQIQTLVDCGVTRVSLGIQDFDGDVQQAIHREQPVALIEQIVGDLKTAGITRINFDLMYGLPRQTPASMEAMAKQVCRLAPDRLALFSYAHLPHIKKHQKALEAYGLPDDVMLLALEGTARDLFESAGYRAIGMDHFAKPHDSLFKALEESRLHRNFQGYTDDPAKTLMGLGTSAISRTPEGYFQNEREEMAYRELVQKGGLATRRGVPLTKEDMLRGDIIETLMCYMTCDLEALCRRHNYPLSGLAAEREALKPFDDAGIIVLDGPVVRLNIPHRMAIRVVAQIFDTTACALPAAASRAA